jgi:DNA-binding transcriptional MerR regulator
MQDQQQSPVMMQSKELVFDQSHHHCKKKLEDLPEIPDKIYFTIGEASRLCRIKPYVLRYWEEEFPTLVPDKRRGNRRYYKRSEIVLIRRIRSLLYEHGFTIDGARVKLANEAKGELELQSKDSVKSFIQGVIAQLSNIVEELEHR